MDPALMKAAEKGDVKFLKKAVAKQPSSYFLAKYKYEGNIFHIAVSKGKVEFLKEAMNILPKDLQKQLFLQTTSEADMFNLLHLAAYTDNRTDILVLVKCIKEMYESLSWDDEDHVKPWLALSRRNETPLNVFLRWCVDEKCVMEIMLMDREHESWTIADEDGNLPLYYALKLGYDLIVESILKYLKEAVPVQPSEYFFAQSTRKNVFHVAVDQGNVEFMKEAMNILPTPILKPLLLHTTDEDMYTVLHCAALNRDVTLVKYITEMYALFSWVDDEDHVKPWLALTQDNKMPLHLALGLHPPDEKCVMEILLMDPELTSCTITDEEGNTPLYYALKNGLNLVAENILMYPLPATSIISSSNFLELISFATTNCSGNVKRLLSEKYGGCLDNDGNTSLHSALNSKSTEEVVLDTLSTYPALCKIRNNRGESPFFLAISCGYEKVADEIMRIDEPRFCTLRRNDGTTVLHGLSSCSEETGRMLLKKYWWIINLKDDKGNTALDYAKQEDTLWLVNLLANPSLIQKEEFDWIEACKREESDAVIAFINNCQDLQSVCRQANDTPLHHIKLLTFEEYHNFLKIPSIAELKNTPDHDGATALHRAIERKDMLLVKILLLDDGVERIIKDHSGSTAMDLLAKLCTENGDWEKMCKQIKANPYLRTTYIQPGTNLEQIRNTLSVIAALLATITFAAGFTIPGGINSNNGEALLGKKAAFLVFLLADAYAMCTSMLVLFCLVWSMVSEPDMARFLVDRSVFILMHSLYATLLAFMTGVYTVIQHTSLWAAIVIFVMCSIIAILANRTILNKVIAFFVPAGNKEKQDQTRLLEEGRSGRFTMEEEDYSRCYILRDILESRIMSIYSFVVDRCKYR